MEKVRYLLKSLPFISFLLLGVACGNNPVSSILSNSSNNPILIGDPKYTIPSDEEFDSSLDANGAEYALEQVSEVDSPLKGKTIYWLGSSVTYGSASNGVSMADYIAKLTGSNFVKDAVSGTTIFSDGSSTNSGEKSYTSRLTNSQYFDKTAKVDAFVCQISTNDCISSNLGKRGRITDEDTIEMDSFNLQTSLGGVEYIISYVINTWNCPVYFYSGAYFSDGSNKAQRQNNNPKGSDYSLFVDQVQAITDKWNDYMDYHIEVIDLFNDEDFNKMASNEYYAWATSDPIHPKKAGYLEWWSPYIQNQLEKSLVKIG